MPWTQTLMIAWLQFAVASFVLLMVARIAINWLSQPVDSIRGIQITLAAILSVPIFLVVTPLPIWHLGLLHPPVVERPDALASRPMTSHSNQPEMISVQGHADAQIADSDLDSANEPMPVASELALFPAIDALSDSSDGQSNRWLDHWFIAALSVGLLHVLTLIYFLTEWYVGARRLRQLTRSATEAPAELMSIWESVAAGLGGRVRLLVSSTINTPLTFGWRHPVIILPQELVTESGTALRYCLSHEFSHIERGDILVWNGAWAFQFVLWYQPLFWTLWRELRINQDILADNRSTRTGHDAVEYSELLMSLARKGRTVPIVGALTFFDHPSQLTRRIKMLIEHQSPLRPGCSWRFSMMAVTAAIFSAGLLTGIRLDAAPHGTTATESKDVGITQAEKAAPEKPAKAVEKPADKSEHLTYHCVVVDKATGKGIRDARVLVRSSWPAPANEARFEETRHVTDADGKYVVEVTPSQLANRDLHLEFEVEHDGYAFRSDIGGNLKTIRAIEALGERPAFERIELNAAEAAVGRVVTPEGKPLAEVRVLYISVKLPEHYSNPKMASFVETKTAADGTFRLILHKEADGFYWVFPDDYAIVERHIGIQRGNLGDVKLIPGIRIHGRVLSSDDKPLSGLPVNITFAGDSGFGKLPVGTAVRRSVISDAGGRFTFAPIAAGDYQLTLVDLPRTLSSRDKGHAPLPGVFVPQKVTVSSEGGPREFEIRAIPDVKFHARYVDHEGKARNGEGVFISGKLQGKPWKILARPDSDGQIATHVPRGLQDARIVAMPEDGEFIRYRRAPGAVLEDTLFEFKYGTIDEDVNGFEIVCCLKPVMLMTIVDESGMQLQGATVHGEFASDNRKRFTPFREVNRGRFRSLAMPSDQEVKLLVDCPGYATATQTVKLREAETKDIVIKLKPGLSVGPKLILPVPGF